MDRQRRPGVNQEPSCITQPGVDARFSGEPTSRPFHIISIHKHSRPRLCWQRSGGVTRPIHPPVRWVDILLRIIPRVRLCRFYRSARGLPSWSQNDSRTISSCDDVSQHWVRTTGSARARAPAVWLGVG